MAGAKLKQGLDYFPMATRKDSRFKVIRALHGCEGYVILNTLLQDIHGEKGYFAKWNERLAKIFALENGFSFELTAEVIKDCFTEGILDEDKFISYQILTSADIQHVWINVAKERKEIIYNPEYLLIDITPYLKKDKKEKDQPAQDPETSQDSFSESSEEEEQTINTGINSIIPSYNGQDNENNLPDDSTRKGSKAEELKEEKQIKQAKKSEALNFSLAAENFPPGEKGKLSDEKKKEILGDNFILLRPDIPSEIPKNKSQKSLDKPENFEINIPEIGEKQLEIIPAKQEEIFQESPEKGEKIKENSEKQEKSAQKSEAHKQEKKGNSTRKQPHPTRSNIIALWEEKFGQPYENSLTGNQSINQIIRHLEKLIRRARDEDPPNEDEVNSKILDLWKVILDNWDKLEKFYKNLIRFESIAKYLTEIINQLKEYGTDSKKSKQSNTSGQKPSFDRFRRAPG